MATAIHHTQALTDDARDSDLAHAQALAFEARVGDVLVEALPDDLYIPPSAFAVLLDYFEGPLDFLLYLVRKSGFDLREIDIAPIAEQYLNYIHMMQNMDVELASDYMVMAALLADIKSRLLLPKPKTVVVEDDPRKELMRRLEAYAKIKEHAGELNQLPVLDRDVFVASAQSPNVAENDLVSQPSATYDAQLLQAALAMLLKRPKPVVHDIVHEAVHLQERIESVRQALQNHLTPQSFNSFLKPSQGKMGVVVTLMAVLELLRQQEITSHYCHDSAQLNIHLDGDAYVSDMGQLVFMLSSQTNEAALVAHEDGH